jgi:hypothetical protein
MKRFRWLCCALFFCLGCASDGSNGEWDEFWKDLRGDNMKMRLDFWGKNKTPDRPEGPQGID